MLVSGRVYWGSKTMFCCYFHKSRVGFCCLEKTSHVKICLWTPLWHWIILIGYGDAYHEQATWNSHEPILAEGLHIARWPRWQVDFNEWDALIRVIFSRRRKTLRAQFKKLTLGWSFSVSKHPKHGSKHPKHGSKHPKHGSKHPKHGSKHPKHKAPPIFCFWHFVGWILLAK